MVLSPKLNNYNLIVDTINLIDKIVAIQLEEHNIFIINNLFIQYFGISSKQVYSLDEMIDLMGMYNFQSIFLNEIIKTVEVNHNEKTYFFNRKIHKGASPSI